MLSWGKRASIAPECPLIFPTVTCFSKQSEKDGGGCPVSTLGLHKHCTYVYIGLHTCIPTHANKQTHVHITHKYTCAHDTGKEKHQKRNPLIWKHQQNWEADNQAEQGNKGKRIHKKLMPEGKTDQTLERTKKKYNQEVSIRNWITGKISQCPERCSATTHTRVSRLSNPAGFCL